MDQLSRLAKPTLFQRILRGWGVIDDAVSATEASILAERVAMLEREMAEMMRRHSIRPFLDE